MQLEMYIHREVESMKNIPNIKMKLVFSEVKESYLLDISSLLYDFELLHDYSLLIRAQEYTEYKFSQRFWYRNGRPLKRYHRLRAVKIIKESPLTVELILAGVAVSSGALWTIFQIAYRVVNWKLNREKLEREVEKLRREIGKAPLEEEKTRLDLDEVIRRSRASGVENSLVRRFEDNPIRLEDIELSTEENN